MKNSTNLARFALMVISIFLILFGISCQQSGESPNKISQQEPRIRIDTVYAIEEDSLGNTSERLLGIDTIFLDSKRKSKN